MKNNIAFMSLMGILISVTTLYAHPPSEMTLEYSADIQTLHILMRHTTHDPREDYIRKIKITKNHEDPVTMRYNIQPNTLEFSKDLKMEAEAGDVITVKAFSREGGSETDSITIQSDTSEDGKEDAQTTQADSKRNVSKGSGY